MIGAVGLYHFNLKDEGLKQLLLSHLNYELGLEPSINITAFFINFEDKIVVNVFDDRGLDYLVINDQIFFDNVKIARYDLYRHTKTDEVLIIAKEGK